MSMNDPMAAWTPEDDIAMIKVGDWPCFFALPLKRTMSKTPNIGCITPDEKTVILLTSIWDFDPDAKTIKYDSVEEMVGEGWMVD